MYLCLMGSFSLEIDDQSVRLPLSAQRLVAFLALARKPVSRLYAAGHLWPDASETRAAASLRSALWRVKRTGRVVLADAYGLELDPAAVVDVDVALAVVRRLESAGASLQPADVTTLCRSDELLPGWYDEPWLDLDREIFRKLRVRGLERLSERLMTEGRLDEALEAGVAAVTGDPLRETAHRALIRVHLAEGNNAEAARQYLTWERLSERSLGLSPSRQLRSLVDA